MIKKVDEIYDKFLGINTEVGSNDVPMESALNYNYCPLQYWSIENLFRIFPFKSDDHIVDFGCGKGRVLIMSAYHSCKNVTGYELDLGRYEILLDNIKRFTNKFNNNSTFNTYNVNVENIVIDDSTNKYFFFNPFHCYTKKMMGLLK